MNAAGRALRRVTPKDGGWYSEQAFSPDGRQLLASGSNTSGAGIFEVNVDGSGLHLIRSGGFYPKWSPDGSQIAFEAEGEEAGKFADQIWVMDSNGTNPRQLTRTSRFHGRPDWSPDGSEIAYIGNEEGDNASDIYVINPDGTGQRRVHDNPVGGNTESLSWSPDGRQFVFSTYLGPDGGAPFTYRLHTVFSDGTGESAVVANESEDDSPAWQPVVPLS